VYITWIVQRVQFVYNIKWHDLLMPSSITLSNQIILTRPGP